ncbi:hypothetical protein ACTVH1_17385 [Gluconobacter cerinus]
MNTMQGLSSTQYNKRGAGPGSPECSVRKGLGILEILLALFISGLAIAGALLLYDNTRVERMANDFKQEIALVQAAFHSLATSNSKLSLTEWAITPLMPKQYWATTAGSYNSTMHIGSNGLKSPWGGTLNVYQPTTTSGTYRMDTRNMSRRLCHELLSMPWSSMQVSIVAYSCDNEQQYSNYINLQAMQW